MKRPHPCIVAWLCVLLATILGCGSPSPEPVAAPSTETKTVTLPDLDQPLGPLDGNRINVPPPKGWQVAPRSSSCLVRFKASPTLSYPSILVTAEDYQEMATVSGDNVGEFATQVAATMDDDPAKLAVDVTPTTVGRRSYVTYQRLAKVKQAVLERMFLDTVVAGRKYQFELRTLKGTLGKFEPYLLAVAGGTEYLADSAPAAPGPAEAAPAIQPAGPVATAESPAQTETSVEATAKTSDTAGKATSATTGQTAAAVKPAESAPKEAVEAAQPKPAAAQPKPPAAQPKPPAAQTPKKEPVKKEPPKEKPKKAAEFELEDELK